MRQNTKVHSFSKHVTHIYEYQNVPSAASVTGVSHVTAGGSQRGTLARAHGPSFSRTGRY